jgi:hypothetical protein
MSRLLTPAIIGYLFSIDVECAAKWGIPIFATQKIGQFLFSCLEYVGGAVGL